jgi:glycosyltransferase involved in cell wall biosynthesis/GT2 family glycosyltransferase
MTDVTALVVVSYGSHALLEVNLARTAEDTAALVVVVDNWSSAEERRAVGRATAAHGWDLVAMADNGGFGRGVNAGVERAAELGADVVVLLNPDLGVDGTTVDALAAEARAEPRSLVAPVVTRPDGREWASGGSLDLHTGRTRAVGSAADPDWISGACLAASVELWREVGGFDESYLLYWEDVDLSFRVAEAGGRLSVRSDLRAVHDPGGTQATAGTRAKSTLYYRHNCRGRLLFAAHHLTLRDRVRWIVTAPGYAREVVLRGGRRQLLRSPFPVLAAVLGTLEGVVVRGARHANAGSSERHLLVAHPSPDLYGSDRQMLETVSAAREAGWRVTVALPSDGPLVPLLKEHGAEVPVTAFPVLRKSVLSPSALPTLAWQSLRTVLGLRARLRAAPPTAVLVNTVTIPVWIVAARLARVPVVCHVHEAEEDQPRLLRAGLAAPMLLADQVVANSSAARRALGTALPRLAARVVVVHNGVPGPDEEPAPRQHVEGEPWQVVLVGRLSPRKGTDVALDAIATLAGRGIDVRLDLCGTVFAGYEWFEEQLRGRAARPDLAGRVRFLGYVHPTWAHLAAADVVVVPSRTEPFGNVAVEGMLARRPVVASRVQGLAEVLDDERTGLLVPPGDPEALAAAITRLLLDAELRARIAASGRVEALERFTTTRYRAAMSAVLDAVAQRNPRRGTGLGSRDFTRPAPGHAPGSG